MLVSGLEAQSGRGKGSQEGPVDGKKCRVSRLEGPRM